MGWGNKKPSPSSSSSSTRMSILARVFPVSWFPKLKKNSKSGAHCDDSLVKREKLDFSTSKGRIYSMDGDGDDEAYWRLSFADEIRVEGGRRSTGGINPLWCGSDDDVDDEFHVPVSGFKSFGEGVTRQGSSRNFNDMVMEVKKTKEQKNSLCSRSKRVDGVGVANLACDQKTSRRAVRAKEAERNDEVDKSTKGPEEKVIFAIEPEHKVQRKVEVLRSPVCNSRKKNHASPVHIEAMEEEKKNVIPKRVLVSESKNIKDRELKGIKVRTESQSRKVVKQRSRVKAYSPRTECKIRALEEMRKARMKLKKVAKERPVQGSSVFDSFAVVKSSFDPHQDFRDSMVEMIIEKGITSSEDLEELLACYLTLNRDEYHDLIIKVFRQVWFELNREMYVDPASVRQSQKGG